MPPIFALVLTLILLPIGLLRAEEQVPYPEFDTKGFCAASVAKMLDETEKWAEEVKCIFYELMWKEGMRPYWQYVPVRTQKILVTTYFKELENRTYFTVRKYVTDAVGEACMISKKLVCQPPK